MASRKELQDGRAPGAWGLVVQRSWVVQRAAWREPSDSLAGDRCDPVVVLVVVEDRQVRGLGCCRDQKVRVLHGAVVQSALVGELFVDLERALPLPFPIGQSGSAWRSRRSAWNSPAF